MSGEERTHNWLLSSMGSDLCDREDDPGYGLENPLSSFAHSDDSTSLYDPHAVVPIINSDLPDDCISSPVDSVELDRNSVYSMDEDDVGPPSVETQPPDTADDLEVSAITSSWISSGGHYATETSMHYRIEANPAMSDGVTISDQVGINEKPTFGPEMPSDRPFYGPTLCIRPALTSSPTHDSGHVAYGDVPDESASSGICGLRNLGNTCFMSAGIQCLVNTPPIAQYFFNQEKSEVIKGDLASCFSQLIHKIWSGQYSSLRPLDFKDAFGQQWRDFRDYRQHDCQEFVTLLLEALRKQMPIHESEDQSICSAPIEKNASISHPSCSSSRSSVSSRSSCPAGGSRESRSSASPTPPQSPHCPPSPLSPGCLKTTFEAKPDLEDLLGLDSGAASPKSSVSSSSVDTHLISLRLQPIPEEVKDASSIRRINLSMDDLSAGCHDGESNASDISDSGDGVRGSNSNSGMKASGGVMAVRQYNQLAASHICDTNSFDCDTTSRDMHDKSAHNFESSISSTEKSINAPNHCLYSSHCDNSPSANDSSTNNKEKGWSQPELISSLSTDKNSKHELDPPSTSNNRAHLSLVKIEDIMKESKTSNVNVLAKDNISNNKLLFDSEKYAKSDSKKLKNSVDNLTRAGIKRVKEVNLLVDKMDNSFLDSSERVSKSLNSTLANSNLIMHKRMRFEEKNVQYQMEKNQGSEFCEITTAEASATSASTMQEFKGQHQSSSVSAMEIGLADQSWKSFIQDGKSAVVDTFYGQFRSSVICSVCGHTSVKFDPFGTLSVPLPHANEIQISTIFVPTGDEAPTRCLITLCKISTIKELKESIAELLELQNEIELVIAEVFDNHIARTVDDNFQARYLNYMNRSIYAFQLASPPPCYEDDIEEKMNIECHQDFKDEDHLSIPNSSKERFDEDVPDALIIKRPDTECISTMIKDSASNTSEPSKSSNVPDACWQQCNICLEEICQTDLKTHENCEDCLLCEDCIEMSCKHHGGVSAPCPVCHTHLSPSDLIPVAKRKNDKPKARILRVSVVFRVDTESTDNNKREMQLIGHPCLLSLPSRIKASTLRSLLEKKLLPGVPFSLLLVDGRGYNCSRCLFSSHCRGCDAVTSSEVVLQASDTLCIKFINISSEQSSLLSRVEDHPSLSSIRQNEPLTLYDCLRAFSQSETLKESESWFCPNCQKKQQATKTIAVWRYPPYLIIHLERFLFHGTVSTKVDDKVIFPLDGLDLTDFVAGEKSNSLLYNLYGCVCHMGVVQAGHYTAVVRSPVTGEWHYFNDDSVTRQKPREEEYSSSYLLFYHRKGTNFNLNLPLNFTLPELSRKCEQSSSDESKINSTLSAGMNLEEWNPSNIADCSSLRGDSHDMSPQSTSEEELKNLASKKMHNSSRESEASSLLEISQSDAMRRPSDILVGSSSYSGDEMFEQKLVSQKNNLSMSPFMEE